jgi:hypothetical protein
MNLAQLLMRAARVHPDRPAVFHGERLVADYLTLILQTEPHALPQACASDITWRPVTASACS